MKTNDEFKQELLDFCQRFKQNSTRMLRTNIKYAYLKDYIDAVTPTYINTDEYPLTMKIYWILNNITEFPKCPICGKDITTKKYSLFAGFNKTCSYEHQRILATRNMQETCMEKYGVSNGGGTKQALEKIRMHMNQKYGVDNVFQSDWFKEYMQQKNMQTHGVDHYSKTQEFKDKCINTNIAKRGVEYPLQSNECKTKMKQTLFDNYGVYFTAQIPGIQSKIHKRYQYDGRTFDSSPEIAFYIWLKDNGISFEYQPSEWFEFECNGKAHRYFPDFKIGDVFYEIKGDQFFRIDESTGQEEMYNPFRDSDWDDRTYEEVCQVFQAKYRCMLDNGVVVLRSRDYAKYDTYVEERYGKGYLAQFKK